jgi:hypothetical protein
MLWQAERLPRRHPALDVPSPGATHAERADLIARSWDSLRARGLAGGGKASSELVDMLNLLAHPALSIDIWVWADRTISGLAASVGEQALLGVVDGDDVWLVPARHSALAEAAVSVAGELPAGVGRSVTLPHEVLVAADAQAGGDAKALVTALEDRDVELCQAQELAGMYFGMVARGQYGVERSGRDGTRRRGELVVGYHDTDAGRYLTQRAPNAQGRAWITVAPADNQVIAHRVWELIAQL